MCQTCVGSARLRSLDPLGQSRPVLPTLERLRTPSWVALHILNLYLPARRTVLKIDEQQGEASCVSEQQQQQCMVAENSVS